MDFNKSKVFGFPRHYLNYKLYNPVKVRYLQSKDYGYFETPKMNKIPELRYLVDRYKQRVEWEKWMNPNGFKLTLSSRFPKVGDTIDFVNPAKFYLVRSDKRYNEDEIKFLVDKRMNKDEIKQFLEKLYKVKAEKVHTAILAGQVKLNASSKNRKYFRTPERKKAVVKVNFKVDEKFRKIPVRNNSFEDEEQRI